MTKIIDIENLTIHLNKKAMAKRELVHGISTHFSKNKITGVVGESGSGKSITMRSLMGLLPESLQAHYSSYQFDGQAVTGNLLKLPISMIFQDSMTSLNPLCKIDYHLLEVIDRYHPMDKDQAYQRVIEELAAVGINHPEQVAKQFPFELSGGMRQRVMIALALLKDPQLLIADEPTTALDVTIQKQILDLIQKKQATQDLSVILVTHDLAVVAEVCDEVKVLFDGVIVEEGSVEDLFYRPAHPYTQELIKAIPRGVNGEELYSMTSFSLSEAEKAGRLVEIEPGHRVLKEG